MADRPTSNAIHIPFAGTDCSRRGRAGCGLRLYGRMALAGAPDAGEDRHALAPPGGAALGFRRNHAKGICFTGSFESNGAAAALSKAPMFAAGSYPATGRFNLATPDPKAPDATVRVRGLGLRIVGPDGSEWRSAMIDAPIFAVSTPQAFYALLKASADKSDPDAMKNFVGRAPGVRRFCGVGRQRAVDSLVCAGAVQQPQ